MSIEQPPDVMIGVFEKARVDFHLAGENRLELRWHVVVGRDFLGSLGELRLRWNHTELLLAREGLGPQLVPTGVELAFVLIRPWLRHVMGRALRPAQNK